MLSFTGSLKMFVAVEPCDMRKGFNGLYAAVTECLDEDPRSGALFVFCNRRRTRFKNLCWDGAGVWLLIKTTGAGNFFVAQGRVAGPDQVRVDAPGAGAADRRRGFLHSTKLRPKHQRPE